MNLDKNLSIDCEKCAINAYCTSQNWGDDDLLISHQSSCPQMSNPQSLTSCACRRPKTCWLPCACERRGNEGLLQEGCNGSCKAFWLFYRLFCYWVWRESLRGDVVQWCHPKTGHHSPATLFGQQLVPHHFLRLEGMLCLKQETTSTE